MMKYLVSPSSLSGNIWIPPSKSHTLRAILFASLAHGKSVIQHYLHSPDTDAMIAACRLMGAKINITLETLVIAGTSGKPKLPDDVINAGNSGQVLRFVAAIAALIDGYTIITGDNSIRHQRPMNPLLSALTQLKGFAVSTKNDGHAPVIIKGPLHAGRVKMEGKDSQPVSAILIAAAFLSGETQIEVTEPGEKPWINLTLDWFKRLGIACTHDNHERYVVKGSASFEGFEYRVPGDFSSAAFPLVAALITKSDITLENVDMNDVQGDKAIITTLKKMNAQIEYNDHKKELHVSKTVSLSGSKINVNDFIDAVPILAVLGCFSESELHISGAEIAKSKESNRLESMAEELKKMNAQVTVLSEGLMIKPSVLSSNTVNSHHDHRIAMALTVAALASDGITEIENVACVAKSYPNFAKAMRKIGANIQEVA